MGLAQATRGGVSRPTKNITLVHEHLGDRWDDSVGKKVDMVLTKGDDQSFLQTAMMVGSLPIDHLAASASHPHNCSISRTLSLSLPLANVDAFSGMLLHLLLHSSLPRLHGQSRTPTLPPR